ncbi:multidrug resistance protein B [Rahnella aquatilis CIP 78.65 = ATCC 33071]|uniref:Drug resistance transporter, EmrB/QacA subfamily n=1 Tax=Rahnella aquatilis (strain ATCC 33071 / DSM 4594 / JCM 1683 / NBRC 105701 / NCIMB 13365 / CIP 78.65) TaxID=745277 RepID=H2IVJ9_RAHAC|nr:DHA2 family efflux MFS transporter permease subunit [Rahnella aquatilis]AEX51786.1 drug resistance transporter, EmrB/QacA subfamily [Rahnella aquatilis CIP 78.65 = ATCC 33071]KFD15935.1 multidrug resistance protein B [Rahnella aquatilis CIP 78.65 = ATCC 33071]
MSLVSSSTLEQGFEAPRRYLAAAAILIGVIMAALDSSIVNISLPSIAGALQVDSASIIWVTNGYQVASAATMLICASLGSRIGERRFYTAGMVLFTLASLGCSLSPSFGMLVTMRILQGVSYAVMISVGLGLYRVIFPPNALGTILGLNALAFAVGTAIGPALGGLIISYLDWPWLFYINLPLGALAIVFSLISLGVDTEKEKGFDWGGAVTSAAALGLMVIAVDQIGRWDSRLLLLCGVASVALLAIFVKAQTRSKSPLLPLDIFHSRRYTFAVISSVSMFVAQGMALVGLPFVLQHAYHYSVLESAFIFTPWPVAVAICAPVAGRLSNRLNPTQISTVGVVIFCLGLGSLALLPQMATVNDFLWRVAVCGIGYGLFLPPNNKEMFSNVAANRTVTASGVLSTARTAGQSIGAALVAMVIALLNGLTGEAGAQFAVYVFGLACLISALSSVSSMLRLHR